MSTPKRKRSPSHLDVPTKKRQTLNDTLNILHSLEESDIVADSTDDSIEIDQPSPVVDYKQRLNDEMKKINSLIRSSIDSKDDTTCQSFEPKLETVKNVDIKTQQTNSFQTFATQGFAESCLPPDVVDTYRQRRHDTTESGKNTVRGEWLQDCVITQTIEPWSTGIERLPQYLTTDQDFVKKVVDFRTETAIQLMDLASKHLLAKADIQRKAAARSTITVENAIDESAPSREEGDALKAKAKEAIDKVVLRDTNREKKHFNDKATRKYSNQVSESDLKDPCSAVIRIRGLQADDPMIPSAQGAPNREPFRDLSQNPRGSRYRGRAPRRGGRPQRKRGHYQPY